jgi:prevent-host-death family protein
VQQITATELKKNLGKYLLLVNKEDIIITRNGIPVAQLTLPKDKKVSLVNQLTGVIPNDDNSLKKSTKGGNDGK